MFCVTDYKHILIGCCLKATDCRLGLIFFHNLNYFQHQLHFSSLQRQLSPLTVNTLQSGSILFVLPWFLQVCQNQVSIDFI